MPVPVAGPADRAGRARGRTPAPAVELHQRHQGDAGALHPGRLMSGAPEVLVADHPIGYIYTRSTGPVIGAFMTALGERRIVGVRASDGRVIVPPTEYDPVTSDDLSE